MIDKLRWGLSRAVPDDATAAWGARLIVTQQGGVDFVHDRMDRQGDGKILDILTEEFPPEKLQDAVSTLLRSEKMSTRSAELFELHKSPALTVVANTNASAGYCYVAAWTTT